MNSMITKQQLTLNVNIKIEKKNKK